MPYAPAVQDRSGEIRLQGAQMLGQGIQNLSEGIAKGFQQYQQNKLMTSQATGKFEGAIKANPELLQFLDPENPNPGAPPEAVKAFAKLRKDGTLALKDAALLSTFADSYTKTKEEAQMAQMRQMQMDEIKRKAQQQATDERAMSSAIAPFTPGGAMDAAIRGGARFEQLPQQGAQFDPAKFMGEYFRQGGSPASLDKVDTYMKMMTPAQAPKPPEGYTWTQGGLTYIPGGPADPANPKNRESQPFQRGNSYADENGNFLGVSSFDQRTGKEVLVTPEGKTTPIPKGAQPITPTAMSKVLPDWTQFTKLRRETTEDERSLKEFSRYMESVNDTAQGLDLLADKFTKNFKTLVGEKNLSSQELALALSQGRLQGLIGANRLATLGGGVMTEQDAMRIIERLGGDVGVLRNKDVVKRLIGEMYSDRYERYVDNLNAYNDAVRGRYGTRGYKEGTPIEFNPDFVDPKNYANAVKQDAPSAPVYSPNDEKRLRELEAKMKKGK